jgi:hypothetical protein
MLSLCNFFFFFFVLRGSEAVVIVVIILNCVILRGRAFSPLLITWSRHVLVYREDSLLGDEIQLRGVGRETHGNVQICVGTVYASVMPSFFISRENILRKKISLFV